MQTIQIRYAINVLLALTAVTAFVVMVYFLIKEIRALRQTLEELNSFFKS